MLGFRILSVLFCLVGLGWLAGLQAQSGQPLVQAQVVEAAVTQTPKGQYQGSFLFRYDFAGKRYETRLDTAVQSSSIELAQREVDELPVGAVMELPVVSDHPEQLNWPPLGKGGRWVGPLAFLLMGLGFWAIPAGVVAMDERKVSAPRAVGWTFAALGLLLLGVSVACLSGPYRVWKDWPLVTAKVEKAEWVGTGKTRRLRLECRYAVGSQEVVGVLISSWALGRQHTQQPPESSPGREVRVRYYPQSPSICRPDLGLESFLPSLALALAGTILGGLALLLRRLDR